ncbi:LAMI_0A01002g1_1 [Lachancea mirantina]|uniref:LAMI_0A01002g1_1 n=1 Tax=Lachancea mirantina TaxID=1230905 RepID=A0A1G4ILD2_9SACH|nr:LAMI_0A01002g1_1 [Lachancea mirantina]
MYSVGLKHSGGIFRGVVAARQHIRSISQLRSLAEFQKAIAGDRLSVIDFYATWCGPCKAVAPHIEKLCKEKPSVAFYKVDVDESPEIAAECQITAMPTFVFAKKGQPIGKVVGADVRGVVQGIKDLE